MASVRACLRNATWQAVLRAAGPLHNYKMVVGGVVLRDWPYALLQQGTYLRVPIMQGHNSGELLACAHDPAMTAADLPAAFAAELPVGNLSLLPLLMQYYAPGWHNSTNTRTGSAARGGRPYCVPLHATEAPAGSPSRGAPPPPPPAPVCCRLYEALVEDKGQVCPEDAVFGRLRDGGATALHGWRIDQVQDCPPVPLARRSPYVSPVESFHTAELGWMFGTVSAWYITPPQHAPRWNCTWSQPEQAFSNTLIRLWSNFAATGSPVPVAEHTPGPDTGPLSAPPTWPPCVTGGDTKAGWGPFFGFRQLHRTTPTPHEVYVRRMKHPQIDRQPRKTERPALCRYTRASPQRMNFRIGDINLWGDARARVARCALWNTLAEAGRASCAKVP